MHHRFQNEWQQDAFLRRAPPMTPTRPQFTGMQPAQHGLHRVSRSAADSSLACVQALKELHAEAAGRNEALVALESLTKESAAKQMRLVEAMQACQRLQSELEAAQVCRLSFKSPSPGRSVQSVAISLLGEGQMEAAGAGVQLLGVGSICGAGRA